MDNCSSHNGIARHVENVKVIFRSPNYTSVLQRPEQGITHAIKVHYRSRLVQRMLTKISVICDGNVNTLEAMQMFCTT